MVQLLDLNSLLFKVKENDQDMKTKVGKVSLCFYGFRQVMTLYSNSQCVVFTVCLTYSINMQEKTTSHHSRTDKPTAACAQRDETFLVLNQHSDSLRTSCCLTDETDGCQWHSSSQAQPLFVVGEKKKRHTALWSTQWSRCLRATLVSANTPFSAKKWRSNKKLSYPLTVQEWRNIGWLIKR